MRKMKNSTILLTGGCGSFGQTFVKEIRDYKLIKIFDNDEFGLWQMRQKFRGYDRLQFIFGDVRDRRRLGEIMGDVDTIIHAAALKHISTCEDNPDEAIKTNIEGSMNVVNLAKNAGIKKALAISTDKAVYPINVYGATKLIMERLFLSAGYSVVRFGNFWASRGSVIPSWESQKGEITITDLEATRYWITLEGAASYAITCLKRMKGGEVFVPKMKQLTLKQLADIVAPYAKQIITNLGEFEKKHECLNLEGERIIC